MEPNYVDRQKIFTHKINPVIIGLEIWFMNIDGMLRGYEES